MKVPFSSYRIVHQTGRGAEKMVSEIPDEFNFQEQRLQTADRRLVGSIETDTQLGTVQSDKH